MNSDNYFLIIDGSSLLFTQFYGNLPREILFAKELEEKEKYFYKIMKTSKGVYTNAVYGFLRYIFRLLRELPPSHLVVNWDISRHTFRTELYPEYKANRGEMLEPLCEQFDLCQQMLERMGIMQLMSENYEADDFSGTVSKLFEDQIPVRIISKDHDYLQLVSDKTELWLMGTSIAKTEELFKKYNMNPKKYRVADRCFPLTPELVKKEYGIEPASVPSLKGLQGDSSDNIKGVPGIGEKAALALIAHYRTVDALYEYIGQPDDARKAEINAFWKMELGLNRSPLVYLLKEDEEQIVGEKAARLCTHIATIKRDVPLEKQALSDYELHFDTEAAKAAVSELEMTSLLDDVPQFGEAALATEITEINDLCEADEYLTHLMGLKSYIGFASGELEDGSKYYAFSENESSETRLIPEAFLTEEYIEDCLAEGLKAGLRLSCFNVKEKGFIAGNAKAEQLFDPALAAYLLAPLKNDYSPKSLAAEFKPSLAALTESAMAYCLYETLVERLEKAEMYKLYRDIELPLALVLYKMEQNGIIADKNALVTLGKTLGESIVELEKKIYEEAGLNFNINSPKQLGEILFEKLGLPHGKKTKTGYSTAVEVLEGLREDYPVVDHILEYRQLSKLKSTYADALADSIAVDGRIHCKFNQMVTATGRLSCTDPNLQNIPVRTQAGREVRKVFVPAEGCVFIDADYSQIELRVLADMSKDQELITAYKTGVDIHSLTASKVFGKSLEEVTPEDRRRAKAVNFGIIYGISSFGLGQGLGLSRKEAEKFIEQYFESYPTIKAFLDGLVASANEKGGARTAFGRFRPIPELSSGTFMQRSFGERVAMNSPIQGTAADIIKVAMINVEKRLSLEAPASKLLLQIHDELLVEAPLAERETVMKILKEEMPAAYKSEVPLEIEINEGKSWYEAK